MHFLVEELGQELYNEDSSCSEGTPNSGAENVAQFEKLRSYYAAQEITNAERTSTALTKSDPSHLSAI